MATDSDAQKGPGGGGEEQQLQLTPAAPPPSAAAAAGRQQQSRAEAETPAEKQQRQSRHAVPEVDGSAMGAGRDEYEEVTGCDEAKVKSYGLGRPISTKQHDRSEDNP